MLSSMTWVSVVCLVVAYTGWIPPDSHNLLESEYVGPLQESTTPIIAGKFMESERSSMLFTQEQNADKHAETWKRSRTCACGEELHGNPKDIAPRTTPNKDPMSCYGRLNTRLINSFSCTSPQITGDNITGVLSGQQPLSESPDVTLMETCLHANHLFFQLGLGMPVFPYMIMAYIKGRRQRLGVHKSRVKAELYPDSSNSKSLATSDLFLSALDIHM